MKTEVRNHRYGKCIIYLYNERYGERKHEHLDWELIEIHNDTEYRITYRNDNNEPVIRVFTQWDTDAIVIFDENDKLNTEIRFN